MALTPVAQPSLLTDRVFDTIHAAIMSGELPAGTQLKVRDLAEQVGTSVMPVREAIRRLEESGLAAREPHKGAVVKSLTMDELVQTYEVRILLEVDAARRGGSAVTDDDCRAMSALCDQLVQAFDEGRIVEALDLDEEMLGTPPDRRRRPGSRRSTGRQGHPRVVAARHEHGRYDLLDRGRTPLGRPLRRRGRLRNLRRGPGPEDELAERHAGGQGEADGQGERDVDHARHHVLRLRRRQQEEAAIGGEPGQQRDDSGQDDHLPVQ